MRARGLHGLPTQLDLTAAHRHRAGWCGTTPQQHGLQRSICTAASFSSGWRLCAHAGDLGALAFDRHAATRPAVGAGEARFLHDAAGSACSARVAGSSASSNTCPSFTCTAKRAGHAARARQRDVGHGADAGPVAHASISAVASGRNCRGPTPALSSSSQGSGSPSRLKRGMTLSLPSLSDVGVAELVDAAALPVVHSLVGPTAQQVFLADGPARLLVAGVGEARMAFLAGALE